jgi:hypothetical protein
MTFFYLYILIVILTGASAAGSAWAFCPRMPSTRSEIAAVATIVMFWMLMGGLAELGLLVWQLGEGIISP